MLFLNIGWMARYQGLEGQPDNIVNGGKWVRDNGKGQEVCNFLTAKDGLVYGQVESSRGDRVDRQINFENLGIGTGDEVADIDIIWTATNPDGGRYVIGWYRSATLYRRRQHHTSYPSAQHKRDQVRDYRTKVLAENAFLLPVEERTLRMPRKEGWMGHTQWWAPPKAIVDPEMASFFNGLENLMAGTDSPESLDNGIAGHGGPGHNGGAAHSSYTRYVATYEVKVTPQHHLLQSAFSKFLARNSGTEIRENFRNADLRFRDHEKGEILCEIKPCQTENARFAIRLAMGQLLDYRQRTPCEGMLIALGAVPSDEDMTLALDNGFGVAYPKKNSSDFEIVWP